MQIASVRLISSSRVAGKSPGKPDLARQVLRPRRAVEIFDFPASQHTAFRLCCAEGLRIETWDTRLIGSRHLAQGMGTGVYYAGMRKKIFVGTLSRRVLLICIAVAGVVCQTAVSQDSASAVAAAPPVAKEAPASAIPSDPKELMLLAAKTNGLLGDDMKPWHLKASYKYFDENDNSTDQGTYEEYWVSPTKYKLIYTSATGSRTEYGTEKGIMISDNETPIGTHDLRRVWISPMPAADSLLSSDFGMRQLNANGEDLNCLYQKNANGASIGVIYCLDPQTSILRFTQYSGGSEKAIRNKIVRFQGHYFAEDLQVYFALGNKGSLTVHLDSIETLNPIDEAIFTPPTTAVPLKVSVKIIKITRGGVPPELLSKDKVHISAGVAQGLLIKKVQPQYPAFARGSGVVGTVVLEATIGKNGHVTNLRVISGAQMLQQAAIDAVKKWVYKPYLLDNEAVEVMTTVNIIFTLDETR